MTAEAINLDDFEGLARTALPGPTFDYFAGGACDEHTVVANRAAFARWWIRPRVLVDVSRIDTSVTVLGRKLALPVLVAPTAFHRLAHADAELATARATAAAGTVYTLSTAATSSIEEVAATGPGPRWFQLYVYKDRSIGVDLVRRAEAAGFEALVLTADTAHLGRRERDVRNRFLIPPGIELRNFTAKPVTSPPDDPRKLVGYKSFSDYIHDQLNDALTWEGIGWLQSITKLPVVLKGVLTAEDARLAVEHGCRGIIVSNHGGRQLDDTVPALTALPEVVEAVAGRAEVLVDGGVRRGTDVLKALALGARAVMLGRPILYGLAAGGEAGVRRVFELIAQEIRLAMSIAGRPSVAAIDRSLVCRAD